MEQRESLVILNSFEAIIDRLNFNRSPSITTLDVSEHFAQLKSQISLISQTYLKDLSLEFYLDIEGCYPMLIERWRFMHTPAISSKFKSENHVRNELEAFQSSLTAGFIQLPRIFNNHCHLNVSLKSSPSDFLDWDKSVLGSDIAKYPTKPLKLETNFYTIVTYCEYLTKVYKPRIIVQNLGSRPRLMSLATNDNDFKDIKSNVSPTSSDSTEISPLIRTLSRTKSFNQSILASIVSQSVDEHESGFKPLAKMYADNFASSIEEDEDFADCSFEMHENLHKTEDMSVSIYLNDCNKMLENTLFNGSRDVLFELLENDKIWKEVRARLTSNLK